MILIILSWIYIIFTTINLGFITTLIFNLKKTNFVIQSILGLFTTTIFASIWAIFGRINIEFHLFLLVLNSAIVYKNFNEITLIYKLFGTKLKAFPKNLKIYLTLITLLIIAQCSAPAFIIDNESYYIQTIKWINQYGFVNGLANLHIFFGQNSGWHVTQSVFNFSFLYSNFNDLSGYCLWLGNIFTFSKLNDYFKNNDKTNLLFGLFPLANIFFFQFISAPSPDLPVYVFTFILFYYFITNFKKVTLSSFNLITILVLFILFIKPTSASLVLIPIIIIVANFKNLVVKIVPISILSLSVFLLFVIKNSIISGYPFFPLSAIRINSLDYAVPKEVLSFYLNTLKSTGFYVSNTKFESLTNVQLLYNWLFSKKIDGLINSASLLILCVTPLFIYNYFNKKPFWIVYHLIVLQMILLFLNSPQYRFFIHLLFFQLFLIISSLFYNIKIINTMNATSIILLFLIVLLPISYKSVTSNKLLAKNSQFSFKNIIIPESNSKFKIEYETVQEENLQYNSPLNYSFFWGNGNGNLPCINKNQIDYFKNYFQIIPQKRTDDLKDGFYSKKRTAND